MFVPIKYRDIRKCYLINEYGEIENSSTNRKIKQFLDRNGYYQVKLMDIYGKRLSVTVHRVVLSTFKPAENMKNLTVNHIDENKTNNHISNLEWVTEEENRQKYNYKNKYTSINKYVAKKIIDLLILGNSVQDIMYKLNVSKSSVLRIRQKKRWKSLSENISFPNNSFKKFNIDIYNYVNLLLDKNLKTKEIREAIKTKYNIEISDNTIRIYKNKKTKTEKTSETIENT